MDERTHNAADIFIKHHIHSLVSGGRRELKGEREAKPIHHEIILLLLEQIFPPIQLASKLDKSCSEFSLSLSHPGLSTFS